MGRTLGNSTYHDLLVWDGYYDSNLHLGYAFTYRDNVNRRTYFTRRGGLMVSALVPGASGPGSSPGRGRSVVFLGKALNSHNASLHPGV